MKIDLHSHSFYSDGTLAPAEVVRRAAAAQVDVLALTDHDSTAGLAEAREEGLRSGVRLAFGIEINTREGDAVHILGYRIDPDSASLKGHIEEFRSRRVLRLKKIVEKLNAAGLSLDWEEIVAVSKQTLGRPHVADVMVKKGTVKSRKEAFDRYLMRGRPGYVEPMGPTPEEAIEAIRGAGGWSSLAHPGVSLKPERLKRWASAGLEGLEIYYPGYSEGVIRELLELTARFDLIPTGGSDFHGPGTGRDSIGSVVIPEARAELLLDRIG